MPKTDTSFSTYTSMMRVTSKGRPFTKDLYDMFAAVLLQTNLSDHRVMFRTYPHTFSTDEAIKVMSSLVFIHIHRKPDPIDPTRLIATRTTTTFSMDASASKHVLQQFLWARLISNATDPSNLTVRDKGLWSPTIKGKQVIEEFTESTQVEMPPSLKRAFQTYTSSFRVMSLDRLADDQITFARTNMTVIFKAMMLSLQKDPLLLLDEFGGIDKDQLNKYQHTFTGANCIEWLCDRLTINSQDEAESVASEFVLFGWLSQVLDKSDKSHTKEDPIMFNTSRYAVYYVTDRGCMVVGWKLPDDISSHASSIISADDSIESFPSKKALYPIKKAIEKDEITVRYLEQAQNQSSISQGSTLIDGKEVYHRPRPPSMSITESSMSQATIQDSSQWSRLTQILETPLMRLYFREFLRSNFCVENINFWVEHQRLQKTTGGWTDRMPSCYAMYETYLSPRATADLNIEYTLRQDTVQYFSSVFVITHQLPPSYPYYFVPPQPIIVQDNKVKASIGSRLLLRPATTQPVKPKIIMLKPGVPPELSLDKILCLLKQVNDHVCRMMAEDSIPKFIKTDKYKELVAKLENANKEEEEESEDDISFEDSSDEDTKGRPLKNSFSDQRSEQRPVRKHIVPL